MVYGTCNYSIHGVNLNQQTHHWGAQKIVMVPWCHGQELEVFEASVIAPCVVGCHGIYQVGAPQVM